MENHNLDVQIEGIFVWFKIAGSSFNKILRSNDPRHSFHVLKVVLVYPCEGAVPMTTMTTSRATEIQKMVFIDSTWAQAKQIYKDPRLKGKVGLHFCKG